MNDRLTPYGERIRTARLRKGWDQDRLGEEIGRDKAWVSREEGGRRNLPDVQTYRALCHVLDIPLRDLLEAKGYLDAEELEDGVLYQIREGDPRVLLLDAVADQSPLQVERLTAIARILISGASASRAGDDVPQSNVGS